MALYFVRYSYPYQSVNKLDELETEVLTESAVINIEFEPSIYRAQVAIRSQELDGLHFKPSEHSIDILVFNKL